MKKGSCITLTWTFKRDEVHEEVTKTHHSTQLSMHEKNLLCNQDSSFNSLSLHSLLNLEHLRYTKTSFYNSWFGFIFWGFSHFLIFFGRHLPHFSRKLSYRFAGQMFSVKSTLILCWALAKDVILRVSFSY